MAAGQELVTIGITCFNAEDTILRALQSALSQDWPHVEVIIVDDMSTDISAELVYRAIADVPHARLIRHTRNLGPAGARNTILREARGEFVVFFDDDDESAPDRVTIQVKRIQDYEASTGSQLVACYASGRRVYPNGYVLDMPAIGSRGTEVPHGPGIADYLLTYSLRPGWFYGAGTPTCALAARRSVMAAVGGFDESFRRVEDADFAIRLGLKGGHCIGCEQCLFTQYATQADDKSFEKNRDAELRLVDKHSAYLRSVGRYYYARNWPLLRYWHFRRDYVRFLLIAIGLLVRHPFSVTRHLFAAIPRRFHHERRMTGAVAKGSRKIRT